MPQVLVKFLESTPLYYCEANGLGPEAIGTVAALHSHVVQVVRRRVASCWRRWRHRNLGSRLTMSHSLCLRKIVVGVGIDLLHDLIGDLVDDRRHPRCLGASESKSELRSHRWVTKVYGLVYPQHKAHIRITQLIGELCITITLLLLHVIGVAGQATFLIVRDYNSSTEVASLPHVHRDLPRL